MRLVADLIIEDDRFNKEIKDIELWCQKVCEKSWEIALKYNKDLPNKEIEISILLADDKKIQELNKEYRGKDSPTNVISFASIDSDEIEEGIFIAGDIAVSFDTTMKESETISFCNHFTHLLVHGMLHLAGFDHIKEKQGDEMERIEIEILSFFEIANPYN